MSEAATQAAPEADKPVSGALVSVVIAITEAGADAREVVEGFGEALRAGGYQSEFVIVLDGPVGRYEDELRDLAERWNLHVVALEGGGLGESIALSAGVAKASGDLVAVYSEGDRIHQVMPADGSLYVVTTNRSPRAEGPSDDKLIRFTPAP